MVLLRNVLGICHQITPCKPWSQEKGEIRKFHSGRIITVWRGSWRVVRLSRFLSHRGSMNTGVWVSGFLHLPHSAPPEDPVRRSGKDEGSHCYVVWCVPGLPELTGIHSGGLTAWRSLETKFGRYSYARGFRLRKAGSLQDALVLFASEGAKHNVGDQPNIF